jgi:hypothetical protein
VEGIDIQSIVRQAVEEFIAHDGVSFETAFREERKAREGLEQRLSEIVQENARLREHFRESEKREIALRGNAAVVARAAEEITRVASQPARGLI